MRPGGPYFRLGDQEKSIFQYKKNKTNNNDKIKKLENVKEICKHYIVICKMKETFKTNQKYLMTQKN